MNYFKTNNKFFSVVVLISLFINTLNPFFYFPVLAEGVEEPAVVAEENVRKVEEEKEENVEEAQKVLQPEPTPQVLITPEVVENEVTPEVTPPASPELTPEPAVQEILPTKDTTLENIESNETECLNNDYKISDSTNDLWDINENEKTSETKNNVQLGVKYIFPLNNKVSVTFKCLPKNEDIRSKLKIQMVKVTDLNLPNDVVVDGEYAFDITTNMENGDFEYDITFPKSKNADVTVSYIEKSLDDAKKDLNDNDIKSIDTKRIDQKVEEDSLKIKQLDHFTIYFVQTYADNTFITVNNMFSQGETVYAKATRDSAANMRLRFKNPSGIEVKLCSPLNSTEVSCEYVLPLNAQLGEWEVEIGRCDSNCGSPNKWTWGLYDSVKFTVVEECGVVSLYEKSNDFADAKVNIDFKSNNNSISVSAKTGYSITKVWLDVDSDGKSGYYLYSEGPVNNLNPNPGNNINSARVEVIKLCETPETKIDICHSTASQANPYNLQNISINSVSKCLNANGHGDHSGDIIPPYTYGACSYPGLNWDSTGQAIYNNSCVIPPQKGSITIIKNDTSKSGEDFTFNFGGISIPATQFTLDDDTDNTLSNTHTISNLNPNIYDISEVDVTGWKMELVSCTSNKAFDPQDKFGEGTASFSLIAGEDIICTFTNTKILPICGNYLIEEGEQCDDGNISNGDGCSSVCQNEFDCGNGIVEANEQCDYGDENGNGYCLSNCEWNTGVCLKDVNMVYNGNFEKPVVETKQKWNIYPNGSPYIGWGVNWFGGSTNYSTQTRPEIANLELHKGVNGWNSFEGNQYAELDSDWDGPLLGLNGEPASVKISQTLPTMPGYNYEVKYYFSPRPNSPTSDNKLSSYWGGNLLETTEATGGSNTNWVEKTFTVPAENNTTTIAFADSGTPNSMGTFIDNVSVTCIGPQIPACVEDPTWASKVESNNQGKTKNGSTITDTERTDPNKTLGINDGKFYSLGYAGSIVLSFSGFVTDKPGNDLTLYEVTNNRNSYGIEKALVEVSKNGVDWTSLGEVTNKDNGTGISGKDINGTGLTWIKYVKITDTTNDVSLESSADGYDLDAVYANNQECAEPLPQTGDLTICKYNDLNKNGEIDDNEEKLWWEMTVTDKDGVDMGEIWYTATPANDCLTLNGMDFGEYEITEKQVNGWTTTYPTAGYSQVVTLNANNSKATVNFLNYKEPVATIIASKIVCTNEADLPNWGNGGANITAETATNWVNTHESCSFAENWNFQWGNAGVAAQRNPGDNTGESLNSNWHKFGPTDTQGVVQVNLSEQDLVNNNYVWVREVWNENYIPFTYGTSGNNNSNNVTAEIYCHTDVLNYDNLERVDGIAVNNTYYCVAFNSPNTGNLIVHKFNDLNANGLLDVNEPGLENWEIGVYAGSNCTNQVILNGLKYTNNIGDVEFTGLIAGEYSVKETLQNGWSTTTPECINVTVVANTSTSVNVGNVQLGEIKGFKWLDTNINGFFDCSENDIERAQIYEPVCESKLGDWVIYIDKNNNKIRDLNEQYVVTNNDSNSLDYGNYIFANLLPGEYSICEEEVVNWVRIFPASSNCQSVTVLPTQIQNNVIFGNVENPKITINKFNDLNKNGIYDNNEKLMANWDLSIQSEGDTKQTKTTNESGSVMFSVNPNTYTISETQQPGWEKTNIYCESDQQGRLITKPGEAYGHHGNCAGWNGCNDAATCALWACEINGCSGLISYGAAKPCTEFENCHLFYSQGNIQWNWGNWCGVMGVSDIICKSAISDIRVLQESVVKDVSDDYKIQLNPGDNVTCYVGNHYAEPKLTIEKFNNVNNGLIVSNRGGIVKYSIKIKATDNSVLNVNVTDLPPLGFVVDTNSITVESSLDSSKNTSNGATYNPNYASPGVWNLGNMQKDEEVIITYNAKIDNNIQPGLYKDLAWAQGEAEIEELDNLIALAGAQGYIDENFVGTAAKVELPASKVKAKVDLEEVEEESGDVLGASSQLPATGSPTMYLFSIMLLLVSGITLYIVGKKQKQKSKSKNFVFFLSLVLVSFMFTSNVYAVSSGLLSVRLQEPQSPTNSSFNLSFVTLFVDTANSATPTEITINCYAKKQGDVWPVLPFEVKTLISDKNGNSGYCTVNTSNTLTSDATYEFKAIATANGATDKESSTVVVIYDDTNPGKPKDLQVDKQNSCKYDLEFKTAKDSGQTNYVEIYRSDDTDFTVNNDSRIKSINVGSDEKVKYTDNLAGSQCGQRQYYALRAFDANGNASSVVAEDIVKIKFVSSSSSEEANNIDEQTTVEAIQILGGSSAANLIDANVQSKSQEGEEGDIKGDKDTSKDKSDTSKSDSDDEKNGVVKGISDTLKNNNFWLIGLGVLFLVITFLGFVKYINTKQK